MARKPGPKKGTVRLTQEHRDKIRNSKILDMLIGHAVGSVDMSQTQVTAGLALMKKVLPDLQSVELTGDSEAPLTVVHEVKWTVEG